MGLFFFQLAAVFILQTERWGMVIENCQRMGHFCCLQLHFFQLWKAKLRKYKKVEEKWLFIPFLLILCYNLAKNQLPNTFFEKNMKIFHFLTPQMPKNCNFQRKKCLSNLIQASIINKTCSFLAYENKKSCGGQILEFS